MTSKDILEEFKLGFLKQYAKSVSTMKSNERIVIEIDHSNLKNVAKELVRRFGVEGVILSTIVGTDFPKDGKIRVDYFINIVPIKRYVVLRTFIPRDNPQIDSLIDVFKASLSGECETYDLLGVRFKGNKHLRRGFFVPVELAEKGIHPLRKDSGV